MKLKRDPNTCHWCGNMQGPHPWPICPANGRQCTTTRCKGYDHFARVFLELTSNTTPNNNLSSRGSGRGRESRNSRRPDRNSIHAVDSNQNLSIQPYFLKKQHTLLTKLLINTCHYLFNALNRLPPTKTLHKPDDILQMYLLHLQDRNFIL